MTVNFQGYVFDDVGAAVSGATVRLFATGETSAAHTRVAEDTTDSNGHWNFATAADEILIGVDASKEAFIRPIAQNADSGATFTAQPDDQFAQRSDKVGFYGSLEEGRVCIDARAVAGLVM